MYTSLHSITPPIAYATKLDIWIIGCFLVVCGTVFETVFVVYVKYHHLIHVEDDAGSVFSTGSAMKHRVETPRFPVSDKRSRKRRSFTTTRDREQERRENIEKLTMKLDKWFAVVSLLAYSLFCLVYWIDLLRNVQNIKE